ncbi:MAG: nucleotide exchange factor GrpE [Oscillibacter sp.]|jgi:molecular chaperone GrpE|nr:nucleotide exchange factor GrpE [Oscillibacter sp.]
MNEEKKNPENQPVNGETQAGSQAADAAAAPETEKKSTEPAAESDREAKHEKSAGAKSRKKEKTYTLTREQMESAELAARQLASVKDQFVRLTAEYDNYRKRTAREKESVYQDAKADTIQAFLAVYDNLERAVNAEGGEDSPHKKGLEMIFGQYKEILGKLGVTEMDAKGQPFDPNRHNAVMHIEDETLGENIVADVFQAGFMLGDRVLRFATVRVAN